MDSSASSAPLGRLAKRGTEGCPGCRGPPAPKESLVPVAPRVLWATQGPLAWRALWERRAQRGPREDLVPAETRAPLDPRGPRGPGLSYLGCSSATAGVSMAPRTAWRRCWPPCPR